MESNNSNKDLKSQILNKIENESLTPRSRWFFSTQEGMVWALWVGSVILGALAVAVTLFVLVSRHYALYEATHDSFLTYLVEFIPYLWIAVFAVMAALAVYNLRHTKTGYKYPLWKIFGSSFLLSVIGGFALHLAGVGFMLDHQIGRFTSQYQSQDKLEQRLWQNPEQGRLVGYKMEEDEPVAGVINFMDVNGVLFKTNIEELQPIDSILLDEGERVKMLGRIVPGPEPEFHACAVFPLLSEEEHSISELIELRDEMRAKIQRHINTRPPESIRPQNISDNNSEPQDTCAEMPIMNRFIPKGAR